MAMAGAQRIFALIDEEPEVDDGYVTLVNVKKDGENLIETDEVTGLWAWKHPHQDGTLTYTKMSGSSTKLLLNKTTGKVTVKKGTKKGKYKNISKIMI